MSLSVNEPVRVWATGTGGYPLKFHWRGRFHSVRTVEGYDRRFTRGPGGRGEIRKYRLRTDRGLRCVLIHDPMRNAWRLERVRSAPGR